MTGCLDRPSWWLPFSVPVCFCSFLLPLFFCLARSRCVLNYSDLRFKRAQESVRPTPIWCIWKKGSLSAWPVHPRLPGGWGPESSTPLLIVFIFTTPCFSSQVPSTTAFLCRQRSYTISPTVQRFFATWSLVWM